MNKKSIIFSVACLCFVSSIVSCFLGCSSAKPYTDAGTMTLKDNEGVVVFRIHNPSAGMEGWYFRQSFIGSEVSEHLLSLHSEVMLATPGHFYTIENNEADQLVALVLPEGEYFIDKIGRNSWFDSPSKMYTFTVSSAVVNYVGDFYFHVYLGTSSDDFLPISSALAKGLDTSLYDWYSYEVKDMWSETASFVYSAFPDLEMYSVVADVAGHDEILPKSCWGERAEVTMGEGVPVYQKDGIWYFTLEPL